MTEDELNRILEALRDEQSDNLLYEAKAARLDFPKTVAKSLCAFANMPGGGTILFGIDENNNFAVSGVYDAKQCQKALASYAQNEFTVPILVDISLVNAQGKKIVVGVVHESKKNLKPVKYKKTNSAFIRQYDNNFELSALEEKLFETNQGIVRYDEEPVANTSIADLNKQLTDDYIVNRRSHSDVLKDASEERILVQTGVVCPSGELSTAGLMALGNYPQQFFPNYTIKASNVRSSKINSRTRAVNVRSFDGPVPTMLENALRWISENSDEYTMDMKDGNVKRVGEFPGVTCRELIANSLIHRDLSPVAMIEAITLKIEDSRLVLSNFGGLFGLTIGELGKSASRTRNTRLAEICQYVPAFDNSNVIEKLGSGIRRMYEEQDKYDFKRPQFFDGEIYFTAILNRGVVQEGVEEQKHDEVANAALRKNNEELIMAALSEGALSRAQLEAKTKLTTMQVRYALQKLTEKNVVEKIGKGNAPGVTYALLPQDE